MKSRFAFPALVLLSLVALTAAGEEKNKEGGKKTDNHPGLEQFKQLAGDWVGTSKHGDEEGTKAIVSYKVTSGGSAVIETIGAGTDHEMVTIIHEDGKDLVLTHYCALGNQPRMKADGKGEGKSIAFNFTGGTNMKSEKDPHMHSAKFTFVDKDTLKAEWTMYADGKESATATFDMKRKK